jgi:ankyrin repeat protein
MKISSDTPVMHVTQTAFVQAIKTHDYIAVQHLLDKVLVNYHDPKTGMTALHYAVRTKQPPCLDTITILYQAGADVNAQTYYGRTCLHHLARFGTNADGTWGIQRSKKNAGTSKPNIELNNIHHHLGQCTSLLLQFGALVNIADPTGNTPLHFAAEFGGVPQVLEVLILEGNADLSWKNKKGATPLDVCKSDEIRNTIMGKNKEQR